MANKVLAQLVRYVKALDLPEVIGLPSNGSLIFSQGNELKRTDINNVVSEIIRANFEIITQTTVVPSVGYRRYRVVEAGSYTMPDGDIIVTESQLRNNFVYIVVDEGISVLELIPIGVESIIKDWDTLEFGLEYPEVRYYNGSIYRVIEGQTTDANDPPSISAKWEVIVQDTTSFLQLINNNTNSIGDLGLLETTNTSDLVSAINELSNTNVASGNNILNGLRVVKRPSNNDDSIIQNLDFAEGWVNANLFVSGFWKGADNPSIGTMQIKTNWSNYTEF